MYCSNCGAEISEKDAYCPYCGVMNARAAEREYMEKLEDIREDTERLGEESGKESRRGMTIAGKKALKIFAIVIQKMRNNINNKKDFALKIKKSEVYT